MLHTGIILATHTHTHEAARSVLGFQPGLIKRPELVSIHLQAAASDSVIIANKVNELK